MNPIKVKFAVHTSVSGMYFESRWSQSISNETKIIILDISFEARYYMNIFSYNTLMVTLTQ